MAHELPLLTNTAIALAYALVGGIVAKRLHLPPLVGYLVAGVAVGPFTPGFNGDQETIQTLAELGVLFLMFGVGLHFSFSDLWQVRNIAIPGALFQMGVATALGYSLARSFGWAPTPSLVLGVACSVASTVVLLRALMDNALLDTEHGKVAVGWLVLEDLATIAILVLLPLLSPSHGSNGLATAAIAIGKAGVFLTLMLIAGKRLIPWALRRVVWLQSRELFIVAGLTLAVGTALLSAEVFGVSIALGAFVAGVIVSESPYGHQVGADLAAFREAFAVLFFVSVGMLVNPSYLSAHWQEVVALSLLIVVGKAILAACAAFVFPYPARTALVVAAGLSQIGEFSFIVGQTGVALGLLDASQYSLILAGALVSITVNPFVFRLVAPVERALRSWPRLWAWLDRHGPVLPSTHHAPEDHVVIIGWGRVGRHVADVLGALGVPRLVIESDSSLAEALTQQAVPTLFGEAGNSEILGHANLRKARALVITVPDESVAALATAAALRIAPGLHVIARAGTQAGARQLFEVGAQEIVRPELEGGLQVLRRTLLLLDYPVRRIQDFVDGIRRDEFSGNDPHASSFRLLDNLAASDLDLEWVSVAEGSAMANVTIAATSLRPRTGASIVALSREGVVTSSPAPEQLIAPGSDVALIGTAQQLDAARALFGPGTPV